MILSDAKKLPWGTYGLSEDGDIRKPGPGPLRWITLGACTTDHLGAILQTQYHITNGYRFAILLILKARGVA